MKKKIPWCGTWSLRLSHCRGLALRGTGTQTALFSPSPCGWSNDSTLPPYLPGCLTLEFSTSYSFRIETDASPSHYMCETHSVDQWLRTLPTQGSFREIVQATNLLKNDWDYCRLLKARRYTLNVVNEVIDQLKEGLMEWIGFTLLLDGPAK